MGQRNPICCPAEAHPADAIAIRARSIANSPGRNGASAGNASISARVMNRTLPPCSATYNSAGRARGRESESQAWRRSAQQRSIRCQLFLRRPFYAPSEGPWHALRVIASILGGAGRNPCGEIKAKAVRAACLVSAIRASFNKRLDSLSNCDSRFVECRPDTSSKLQRIVVRPEMHEEDTRLLRQHVAMERCHLDAICP